MGTPAAILMDKIVGICTTHLIPNPATGLPQPAPPMPFSAPITLQLATTVFITSKPAGVVGSFGYNTPPHVGLHPADPHMVPLNQIGRVVVGSPSVFIQSKPAARTGSMCTINFAMPGQLIGTAATVLIA